MFRSELIELTLQVCFVDVSRDNPRLILHDPFTYNKDLLNCWGYACSPGDTPEQQKVAVRNNVLVPKLLYSNMTNANDECKRRSKCVNDFV